MNHKNNAIYLPKLWLFFVASKLLSFFKISMAIGSFSIFFSLSNMLLPLSGALVGFTGLASLLFANAIVLACIKKTVTISYLAYSGIPTFFAGLYWNGSSWYRAGVSLLCMLLFVSHPTGMYAAPYALFWLIPMCCAFKKSSVFYNALGTTFTAHAVGSVLWLYTTNMAATYWYGLMHIVPFERMLFAVGMTFIYTVFTTDFFTTAMPRRLHRVLGS